MAIGASGSKTKTKQSATNNETRTNTLSDRAAAGLNQGIADASNMRYSRFDPNSIGQYQSPYTQDVIDATLARSGQADAIARNEQQAQFAGAGAFGDNRRSIYEAQLAGDQSRNRGELIANLNDRAYGQARDVAQSENQNDNNYSLMIQQLLAQLRGGFANEGTQTMQGTSTGRSSGSNLGFGFSYGGGS
jgi:hypothetical protein